MRYRSLKYYEWREPAEPAVPEWVQQILGCVLLAFGLALLALLAFTT